MIVAEQLTVTLSNREILKDLDLEVREGELLGLIGPNGAGKTTLLRALAGLLRPARGRVTLDGEDLREMNRRRRARLIGYLPHDAPSHWPVPVRRIVELGRLPYARWWGAGDDMHAKAVDEAMKEADVLHLSDRRVTNLSSGERVRVFFARLLASQPRFLLADEPTSALDPYHQLHVMDILRRRTEAGDAVVAVLHDLSLAARFCHRIVLLKDGHILGDGKPPEVLNAQTMRDAYGIEAWFGQVRENFYLVPWERTTRPEEFREDPPRSGGGD